MSDMRQTLGELRENTQRLQQNCPNTQQAFMQLKQAVMQENALTKKEKSLIALGIAISQRCEGCMVSHVSSAVRQGATLQEISETVDVAILMGGGPSHVYGGKALAYAEEVLQG